MADKNFTVNKGLTVANTVIVTSGSNVGFSNTAPEHTVSVGGTLYVAANAALTYVVAGDALGTSGQVLQANSTGGLVWGTLSTAPPGSNTQIPFNDSNTANASAGLVFDKTSDTLTVGNTISTTTVNAAAHTVGSATIANSSGVYTTGVVNAATLSVGSTFKANSTTVTVPAMNVASNSVTLGTTVYVSATGNTGFGNSAPADKLHVQGNIVASGDITTAYSDDGLKNREFIIYEALEKVKALDGFYYTPNKIAIDFGARPERQVGVSAQQVQAVLPEVVRPSYIGEEYLTVQYDRLIPLLIEAIKELERKVTRLEHGS